ncbi:hypothetical protein [Actinoplanes teichomyceticus]|uniref:hypothetical protein n=1 Tax=Actinoplanes teichomyceticus TaxID=1867 RepID=UPI0011A57477|nr:hypothetical protein [Actinoplanes teichomyceticus]
MIEKARVVGVGNNTSALVHGINFHRSTGSLVGVHQPEVNGPGVGDIDFVRPSPCPRARSARIYTKRSSHRRTTSLT